MGRITVGDVSPPIGPEFVRKSMSVVSHISHWSRGTFHLSGAESELWWPRKLCPCTWSNARCQWRRGEGVLL